MLLTPLSHFAPPAFLSTPRVRLCALTLRVDDEVVGLVLVVAMPDASKQKARHSVLQASKQWQRKHASARTHSQQEEEACIARRLTSSPMMATGRQQNKRAKQREARLSVAHTRWLAALPHARSAPRRLTESSRSLGEVRNLGSHGVLGVCAGERSGVRRRSQGK